MPGITGCLCFRGKYLNAGKDSPGIAALVPLSSAVQERWGLNEA
jgi:hypothetical protein